MADELSLDASVSFTKSGVICSGGTYHAHVDVTGSNFVQGTHAFNSLAVDTVDLGDITAPGYVLLNAVRAIASPEPPTSVVVTNVGTPGSTTYTYQIVTVGLGGIESEASDPFTTTTGNATLDFSNYNLLVWPAVEGAISYKIYRTVGGSTQGLFTTAANTADEIGVIDIDQAGDGATPPTDPSITGDSSFATAVFDNQTANQLILLKPGEFALFRLNGTALKGQTWDFPVLVEYTVFED